MKPRPLLSQLIFDLLYKLTHPCSRANDLKSPLCGKSLKKSRTTHKSHKTFDPHAR